MANDGFLIQVRSAKFLPRYKDLMEEFSIIYFRENNIIGKEAVIEFIKNWTRCGFTIEQNVNQFCLKIDKIYPEHSEKITNSLKKHIETFGKTQ